MNPRASGPYGVGALRDFIDFWFWSVSLWTPPLLHPALRDAHRRARLTSKNAIYPLR